MQSFMKIKPSRNDDITLSFTDVVNHALIANFERGKYVFNAIREYKILAKISGIAIFSAYALSTIISLAGPQSRTL